MKRARKKTDLPKRTHTQKVNRKKKGKKVGAKKVLVVLLLLIVVAVIGFFALMGVGFVDESDLLAPIDRESGVINALLLGVDEDGLRTDTIMVASFNLDTADLKLLSIPRDTKVYVKNRNMTRKINEVHAMSTKDGIAGPVGTAQAVTQLTGIPINYYVEFSFDAIEELFDTLGPITYDVPDVEGGGKGMNYEDPAQSLFIHLKPGVQELDGEQVLQFMRYRKGDSDHARSDRQQGIIKAVVEQKLGFGLILKIPKIFSQLKSDISTNLSAGDVSKYAGYLSDLSSDKIQSFQLPGADKKEGKKWYFFCDLEKTKELVATDFGYENVEISTNITVDTDGEKVKSTQKDKKKTTASTQMDNSTKATSTPDTTSALKSTPIPTATPTSTSTPKPTSTPKATSEADNSYISLD